jgi:hypothetical protein
MKDKVLKLRHFLNDNEMYFIWNIIYTYIPLTLYRRRDSKGILNNLFFRDAQFLPELFSYEQYCRRDRW